MGSALSKFPKKSPWMACKNPKKHAESAKINKKPLFLKNSNFIQNDKQLRDLFYEINPDIKILKSNFHFSGNIKIFPKTTTEYLLVDDYTFSSVLYRLTKKHISTEEATNTFSNSTLCLNKINTAITLEDIEETFIYRDIPIKNLKRFTKADGPAKTLITFSLVNNSDSSELLNGLVINNKKKFKLVIKKIGHLTRNCKLKAKFCPKCNNTINTKINLEMHQLWRKS